MNKETQETSVLELTEDQKALLVIGFMELAVHYTEDLVESKRFGKHFRQKLKYHTNGFVKFYDKVLDDVMRTSDGEKCKISDDLASTARVIENAIRAYVQWGDNIK